MNKHPEISHRRKAKRRGLGYNMLNVPFSNSHGHHINRETILYIPKDLHQSVKHNVFTGEGMKEINAKAFHWIVNQKRSIRNESKESKN